MERTLDAILACTPDWGIGLDNNLPWANLGDLTYFKMLTIGKTLVAGMNTWNSIKHINLEHREVLVPTSSIRTLSESIGKATTIQSIVQAPKDAILIGGAKVFHTALQCNMVDKLYLFRTSDYYKCDIFLDEDLVRSRLRKVYSHSLSTEKFTKEVWLKNG